MRICLETDAWYLILQHLQYGRYTMIVSPVHSREVAAIQEAHERRKSLPCDIGMAAILFAISAPLDSGPKSFTPEDLGWPMPRT
jgi:hypothetical protein